MNESAVRQPNAVRTPVTGRFAPSPSGRLHLGNVLCALLSWLSARRQGGRYLLRMEDLDPDRCSRENACLLCDDLRWLGLDWDEIEPVALLPDIPETVQRSPWQSERTAIYQHFYDRLQKENLLYPCFCSRAALHAASAPHLSDGSFLYAGTCRSLTPEQIAQKSKTRRPAMRVRVPDETITFTDVKQGFYLEDLRTSCGDFVLRRADGVFAYQLAVTVDDALMGVTEVVRGRDLLSSTARQIWLHRFFGFVPPTFCHMPLLLDANGKRLSKRDADLDLGRIRQSLSPEQLIGVLAAAAHLIDRPEPVKAVELVEAFDWDKVPQADICLPKGFDWTGVRV